MVDSGNWAPLTALVFHGLGAFAVSLDATAVTTFPTDKIRALFAYLALEPGQPHRREALAGLLWPEMDQTTALRNLRLALHRLRDTLDNVQPGVSDCLIQSTRQTIQLTPPLLTVDVQTFQTLGDDISVTWRPPADRPMTRRLPDSPQRLATPAPSS